ncbi:hypothetical protein JCM11641_007505 [Rhodosporidiobolus odoratus]
MGNAAPSYFAVPPAASPSSASLSTSIHSCASSSGVSTPPSLLFSPGSSPISSLASSPSLDAKRFSFSPPPLFLADTAASSPSPSPIPSLGQPSSTQLAKYASEVIRNEAYALLALAARLAPAAQPLASEYTDELFVGVRRSPSEAGIETDLEKELPLDQPVLEGVPLPPSPPVEREDSRTNVAFRRVVDLITSMPPHGKVIVTGVGKSGIVGKKMVATFCSLGVQAVFLHPLEALHGDLGVVCSCTPSSPCDTLLMISHSGATAELMRLLPVVRPRVRSLIAVTRDADSVLANACHGWLDAGTGVYPAGLPKGTTDEADCTLPAPTNSVVTALAIGDALALTLSRLKIGWDKGGKERRASFFHCHPGGQLGLQLGREGRRPEIPPAPGTSAEPIPIK